MTKEIQGIVKENPVMLEQSCMFLVEQEGGYYLVVSREQQAAKDNIFVKQGQEISIKGYGLDSTAIKGIILTEQAKINIRKNLQKSETF